MNTHRRPNAEAVAVSIGLLFFVLAAAWTQIHVNPKLPSDIAIYLEAGRRALAHEDPYRPFEIGFP